MFLRRYQRTKQGKTHFYYALVESVRTAPPVNFLLAGGPRVSSDVGGSLG